MENKEVLNTYNLKNELVIYIRGVQLFSVTGQICGSIIFAGQNLPRGIFLQNKKCFCPKFGEDQKKSVHSTNFDGFGGVLQRTNKNQGLASVTHTIVSARKNQLTKQCRKFNAGHFETFNGPQEARVLDAPDPHGSSLS